MHSIVTREEGQDQREPQVGHGEEADEQLGVPLVEDLTQAIALAVVLVEV